MMYSDMVFAFQIEGRLKSAWLGLGALLRVFGLFTPESMQIKALQYKSRLKLCDMLYTCNLLSLCKLFINCLIKGFDCKWYKIILIKKWKLYIPSFISFNVGLGFIFQNCSFF